MDQEIRLELLSGGHASLKLPEPGTFPSFYVFSMEASGNVQFWELLVRLMAAAGRPVFAIHEVLRQQRLSQTDIAPSAMERLLRRKGCGFGLFFDVDPALKEIVAGESPKLLFLRDPRDMLMASYRYLAGQSRVNSGADGATGATWDAISEPQTFAEFLQSPAAGLKGERYRRFTELWRQQQNVILLRYEHALSGWHAIAAEIVAALKLPIDSLTVASIAAETPRVGARLPVPHEPDGKATAAAMGFDGAQIADLERRFEDMLPALGYVPRKNRVDQLRPASAEGQQPGPPPENSKMARTAPPPPLAVVPDAAVINAEKSPVPANLGVIFEPDPVLMGRLKPNSSAEMHVLGRRVIMEVDATGCRPVIGQPPEGEVTLAAYGCSCTYGIAIAAEETFCSLLQGMFPNWRVENHGVAGYATLRNLLQLERDIRWSQPEFVTFCWIEDHLYRNVAAIGWIQTTTQYFDRPVTGDPPERRVPRATLDSDGALQIRSTRLPRFDLLGLDFSDFTPDRYYLDLVCFRLLERAKLVVQSYGGHFFVTALSNLSAGLSTRLADAGVPVVAVGISGKQYTCLPDDGHPNALANQMYAKAIREYLLQVNAGQRVAS
jgi:hypothetical protein